MSQEEVPGIKDFSRRYGDSERDYAASPLAASTESFAIEGVAAGRLNSIMRERSYVAEQVRRFDNDRFLCALFAPADRRESLLALYAFNVEVARVRELVSEPLLGEMRLRWWRDTVAAIYAGAALPRHPVAAPLAETVRRFDLTRDYFDRLLDARRLDLRDEPPANLQRLHAYAEDTSATVSLLALEVLGIRDSAMGAIGRPVGIAWALTGLLRAVPFHARARRLYLPADLLKEASIDVNRLLDGQGGRALQGVVRPLVQHARSLLDEARHAGGTVKRSALAALLPATLADGYLARLARVGFDPFDARLRQPSAGRYFRLALNAWRGRF
jgi:phytoene synthase